ncbi:MAG: DNA sulfur modification protein DndB [Solibacillus sp.]
MDYLENYKVPMQIYLQLDVKLERQLFSDINTERREAQPGQLLQYDRRDIYSVLTRQIAEQLKDDMEIELKVSRLVTSSSALRTLVTMKRCIVALFEGSISTVSGQPYVTESNETIQQIGLAFFKQWLLIFPKILQNRERYVSGLSGIQIALAHTVYKLVKEQHVSHLEAIAALSYLKGCTWRRTDPLFNSMYIKG